MDSTTNQDLFPDGKAIILKKYLFQIKTQDGSFLEWFFYTINKKEAYTKFNTKVLDGSYLIADHKCTLVKKKN